MIIIQNWYPLFDFIGNFYVELASYQVKTICEDCQRRLWFGAGIPFAGEGGGVSMFDGQCFITCTTADGLADNHVNAICRDIS